MSIETITISTLVDHKPRDSYWASVASKYYKLKQMRKELAKQEALLKNELVVLSENKSSKGGGYVFSMSERKGAVDYGKVKELHGVNLEVYRKDSFVMWKISKI